MDPGGDRTRAARSRSHGPRQRATRHRGELQTGCGGRAVRRAIRRRVRSPSLSPAPVGRTHGAHTAERAKPGWSASNGAFTCRPSDHAPQRGAPLVADPRQPIQPTAPAAQRRRRRAGPFRRSRRCHHRCRRCWPLGQGRSRRPRGRTRRPRLRPARSTNDGTHVGCGQALRPMSRKAVIVDSSFHRKRGCRAGVLRASLSTTVFSVPLCREEPLRSDAHERHRWDEDHAGHQPVRVRPVVAPAVAES